MTSKNSLTASLPLQLRCARCVGIALAVLASWQAFYIVMNQSLEVAPFVFEQLSNNYTPIDTTPHPTGMANTTSSSSFVDFISHATDYFTPDFPRHKLIQIQNYRDGQALILNFHITHHAGTTLCRLARDNGPVPPFACMGGNGTLPSLRPLLATSLTPWFYNDTDYCIQRIQPVFHYIAWEYNLKRLNRSVNDTNWEHPRLVSIIVLRNPMDRLLTGSGTTTCPARRAGGMVGVRTDKQDQ
jgi:hypothetical protein